MPLSIPTTNVAPTLEEPSTVAFYGDQKIGKSETTAKLNEARPGNMLHIDTHAGIRQLATRRLPITNLAEWKELTIAPRVGADSPLVAAWKAAPFRFLCIDVLDDVEEWALDQANENYRRMPVGKNFGGLSILELDMGLGYGYLRDAFVKLITPVWGNDMWTTIFLVHGRAKFLGSTVTIPDAASDQLDLTGRVRKMICNKVDAVGHWYKDPSNRLKLSFATKEKVICGLRFRYLHNMEVTFSDPAKPEEWAKVWPKTWNRPAAAPATAPAPTPVASVTAPAPAAATPVAKAPAAPAAPTPPPTPTTAPAPTSAPVTPPTPVPATPPPTK